MYLRSKLFVLILTTAVAHAVITSAVADQLFESGEGQTTLIELFTSQGCSSCPPAERWLGDLKDDSRLWKELIPVAFHVDYWDYIGWKDSFAQPGFSARQRKYFAENAIKSVYTPGFVVNGREWRSWFSRGRLPTAAAKAGPLKVGVNARALRARYEPAGVSVQNLILNVALLGVDIQVEVDRGENSGRRLSQDFSVLRHLQLASDDGSWESALPEIELPAGARLAIAVWVNRTGSQKPLQATGGWLMNK